MPSCRRPPAMMSAAPASSAMYRGFSYRMSMTAVPISILFVRAPTAARSGNGEPSWRAKWWTRKYAPSRPSSSAATARSIDCSRASDAVRTLECGDGVQCPNERKPSFFMSAHDDLPRGPHFHHLIHVLSVLLHGLVVG